MPGNEYFDQQQYLVTSFNAAEVANSLVKATTLAQDTVVDIGPSLKRIGYDIAEIEHALEAAAAEGMSDLVHHAEALSQVQEKISGSEPALDNLERAYTKLETNFVRPYEHLRCVYLAANKLHVASALARDVAKYFRHAEILEDSLKQIPPSLVQAATSLKAMSVLFASSISLRGVSTVISYEKKIPELRKRLESLSFSCLREFTSDMGQLESAVRALQMLDISLCTNVRTLLHTQTGATVLALARAVSSPAQLRVAVADAKRRGTQVLALQTILNECELVEEVSTALEGKPPSNYFWQQVARNFGQKLKTQAVSNPSSADTMRAKATEIRGIMAEIPELAVVIEQHLKS